jgi:hypothetical protein
MNPRITSAVVLLGLSPIAAWAQLTDRTQAPNTANAGIAKSLEEQIGAGRGDIMTPAPRFSSSIAIRFAESVEAGNSFSASLRVCRDRDRT